MTTLAVVVAFTTGLLAGCSSMSTSPLPTLNEHGGLPAGASVQNSGRTIMPGDPPTDGPTIGGVPGPPPTSEPSATAVLAPFTPGGVTVAALTFTSASVVNGARASLTNGRWTLDIPKGAIDGNAQVSIGVTAGKSTGCELDITPADANHFNLPVTLTADCHGVAPAKLAKYVIRWYNPSTGAWEKVAGSTVDSKHKTVSAPLAHFSLYSVGPA